MQNTSCENFGKSECCTGCHSSVQVQCELCNQCDELDPFGAHDSARYELGEDSGGSSLDPLDFFYK